MLIRPLHNPVVTVSNYFSFQTTRFMGPGARKAANYLGYVEYRFLAGTAVSPSIGGFPTTRWVSPGANTSINLVAGNRLGGGVTHRYGN